MTSRVYLPNMVSLKSSFQIIAHNVYHQFQEFASEYEFRHITSSPYFLQGNKEAKRAVGTMKKSLLKNNDLYKALLNYSSADGLQ